KALDTSAGAGFGGAIASLGTMRLYGVNLSVNKARFGGALYVGALAGAPANSAHASVEATNFDSNVASRLGGGLYTNNYTTVVTMTHAFLRANSAGDSGGGVARSNAKLSIFDSWFGVNSATTAGGGLYVAADGVGDPSRVSVQSTTFDLNMTAGNTNRGGAIANGYSGSFFLTGGRVL